VSTVTLQLSCPDQRGVVATVAAFVADHGGNILHADQHLDPVGVGDGPVFFQRVEFALDGFGLTRDEIPGAFGAIAERFAMDVRICCSDERERVALLASKQPHCLADLLVRWSSGELP
jgi:formyltetrahydrofolate deformylase